MSEGGKTMMALVVLGLAGVGAYSSGQYVLSAIRSFENEPPPVAKKISPVKPKNFSASKSSPIAIAYIDSAEQEYTFFETLSDSSMTKFTGLEGRVVSKASAQPRKDVPPSTRVRKKTIALSESVSSDKSHHAPVQTEKTVRFENVPPAVALEPHSSRMAKTGHKADLADGSPVYAVQVSSFKDMKRAENLKNKLVGKGYDAFRKAWELTDGSLEVRHRVYLGKYRNRSEANFAASNAHRKESLQTMIVPLFSGAGLR
jgi:cell division septation protein DedD